MMSNMMRNLSQRDDFEKDLWAVDENHSPAQ